MSGGNLAEITQELAAGYPAADVVATQRELRRVLVVALITLAPKAQAARQAGRSSIGELIAPPSRLGGCRLWVWAEHLHKLPICPS